MFVCLLFDQATDPEDDVLVYNIVRGNTEDTFGIDSET